MNLFIKTQNGCSLVSVGKITTEDMTSDGIGIALIANNDDEILGIYSTIERAKEVISEIAKFINESSNFFSNETTTQMYIKNISYKHSPFVFEMPMERGDE